MSDETKVVEVPEKFEEIVSSVEKLSVLDLAELVKVLEKFGYPLPRLLMMAAAAGAGAAVEEVFFHGYTNGGNKIGVIKAVREITSWA